MATEASVIPNPTATRSPRSAGRGRDSSGPDRLTVVLFSLAAFLVVLALLAGQLPAAANHRASSPVLLVRKIYRTTIVETTAGGGGAGGTSVTQSVSNSGSSATALATPTTRSS
jgi:hypothetical protein